MTQKRSADDKKVPREFKRLKSSIPKSRPPEFPKLSSDILDTCFTRWIAYTHEGDVWVSNGNVGFLTHKRILKCLSKFFTYMLEGDTGIEVVEIEEISDDTVDIFRDIIESPKFTRRERFRKQCQKCPANLPRIMKDLLFLVGKFDLKIVLELLKCIALENLTSDLSTPQILDIKASADKYKLKDVSTELHDTLYERMIALKTTSDDLNLFPKPMIAEFMKTKINDHDYKEGIVYEYFEKFARYTIQQKREHNDGEFLRIIANYEMPEKGWNAKVDFHSHQRRKILDILLE